MEVRVGALVVDHGGDRRPIADKGPVGTRTCGCFGTACGRWFHLSLRIRTLSGEPLALRGHFVADVELVAVELDLLHVEPQQVPVAIAHHHDRGHFQDAYRFVGSPILGLPKV